MDKYLNKKILGFVGASVILGYQYVDFKQNNLLLPQNKQINFCIDRQKNDCLNDHLESKFGVHLVSDSTSSIISMHLI